MFALGKAPIKPKSKQQLQKERQKERIRRQLNKTPRIRILRRGECLEVQNKEKRVGYWRLFPRTLDVPLSFLFDFNDSSLSSLILSLQQTIPKVFGVKDKKIQAHIPPSEVSALFQTNQRIRYYLKIFLNRIRLRKLKVANDVDPATFDTPKKVIEVVDWTQKKIYKFEATSLLADIRTRLQHHDYLFPDPLPPRNMVTNLPFTLFQTITVYEQLLKWGYMHWTIESLRYAEYNIDKYALLNNKQLCLKALYQSVFASNDKEILLDFIELQHQYHGYSYDERLYMWAVSSKACQQTKKMERWKKYWYEYHEVSILYEDPGEQVQRLNRIVFFTAELAKSNIELREIRAMVI
jgi:hypothetical protein